MKEQTALTGKVNWNIINALRGLAALYVVINHSRGLLFTDAMDYAAKVNPKASWQWWEWANMLLMQHTILGHEFVILFFVLSGFSIAHSLSHNPATKTFYKRRLIRLYPAYVTGILWAIVVFLIIRFVAPQVFYEPVAQVPFKSYFDEYISWTSILNNLLYNPVKNYLTYQYWSLPLEVVFYILAPIVFYRLGKAGMVAFVLHAIGWWLNGNTVYSIRTGLILHQFFFDCSIYFWLGMILYKHKDRLLSSFKLNKFLVLASLLVLFELILVLKSYAWAQQHTKIGGLLMAVFSYVILFGTLKHNIRIKWLEKVGAYSYTLYVTHMATINIINSVAYHYGFGFHTIHVFYFWFIGVAASLVCGYLLYWVAEYPSIKYLEKQRKKPAIVKEVSAGALERTVLARAPES